MELKPCPFCGGKAEVEKVVVYGNYRVRCMECPTEFGRSWYWSKKEAIEAWNRRADDV